MKLGLDLDNTISEAPAFFALLSQAMIAGGHEVHIITAREPGEAMMKFVQEELKEYGVVYTRIEITSQKHDYILKNGITVYFDDTDEFFHKLPESVTVFKIREAGNFCFNTGRWFYGNHTGDNVHASDRVRTAAKAQKYWRALIRVFARPGGLLRNEVWVVVPEWRADVAVRLPQEIADLHDFCPGDLFYAQVTTDAEKVDDLHFKDAELPPTQRYS